MSSSLNQYSTLSDCSYINLWKLLWSRDHADSLTTFLHPQEKCNNCGAFGPRASSRRSPRKFWSGALAPQSLGSNKKHNLKLMKAQDLQTAGSLSKFDREKDPRHRWGMSGSEWSLGNGTSGDGVSLHSFCVAISGRDRKTREKEARASQLPGVTTQFVVVLRITGVRQRISWDVAMVGWEAVESKWVLNAETSVEKGALPGNESCLSGDGVTEGVAFAEFTGASMPPLPQNKGGNWAPGVCLVCNHWCR